MTMLWQPLLVLLLLLPVLVVGYVWALRRRRPVAIRYSSLLLVREAVPGRSRVRRHIPFVLFLAAIGSLVVALARPAAIIAVPTGQTTVILAMDVSRSMCSTDVPPNRLLAAETAASAFVQRQGSSTRIGIVAFAGFGELIQPPTNDQEVLLDAIQSLTTGRRTAIGSAILKSIDSIAEVDTSIARSLTVESGGVPPEPVPKGAYVPHIIVLLTDGVSNSGPDPVESAQQAVDRGIRIYTIGFGTSNPPPSLPVCGAQYIGREPGDNGFGGGGGLGFGGQFRRGIDDDTLKQVARMTGGEYYSAESADELQKVFSELPTSLILKNEVTELSVFFVAIGVVLAGMALLLGRAWRPLP